MNVKYYDKATDAIVELTVVTNVEPIVNGSKLSLSHATTPVIIKSIDLVEVTA